MAALALHREVNWGGFLAFFLGILVAPLAVLFPAQLPGFWTPLMSRLQGLTKADGGFVEEQPVSAGGTNTKSAVFDSASSQYASRAGLNWTTGDLTIEFDIKFDSWPSTGSNMGLTAIYDNADPVNNSSWIMPYLQDIGGTRYVYALVMDPAATVASHRSLARWSSPFAALDTWYHVAFVDDGSGVTTADRFKLYIDGSLYTTGFSVITVRNFSGRNSVVDCPLGIACYHNSAPTAWRYLDGHLDHLRFWNDKRTATEINDNKALVIDPAAANLDANYEFEDDFTDSTSNGYDLTDSGSPTFSTDVPF